MAPAVLSKALVLAALASSIPAHASTFLGKAPAAAGDTPLLEALEQLLGSGMRAVAEGRVHRLEEALRPTFLSMPKGADGGLGADAVRYVLHRIFVDRHGWFVRGLESGGEAWNSSSPASVFKGQAPDEVHDLFESRLGAHGFDLHHVAVLAATLESLVHVETSERLQAAYNIIGLSQEAASEEQVDIAIDTYMLLYVLGANHSSVTEKWLANQRRTIDKVYPSWSDTRKWARGVRQEVLRLDGDAASFNGTMEVVEAIGDRYGRWQDAECREMKQMLLTIEEPGTGRVRLERFYQSALDGNWQFSESMAYLRQLGALDESDSAHPSVVIPNYVNSPSNCVASSKFYSVCCIDECEGLMGHLERHIAAPDASPERIAELVAELPSGTVPAPRTLPGPLVQKLEQIASQHGSVPIHGRLFAQWMHHAFPRECPYPHLSGTTRPVTPQEWTKQTGESCSVREEEMRWHVEEARRGFAEVAGGLPWSDEEELFISRPTSALAGWRSLLRSVAHLLVLLAVVATTLTLQVRMAWAARATLSDGLKQPHFV